MKITPPNCTKRSNIRKLDLIPGQVYMNGPTDQLVPIYFLAVGNGNVTIGVVRLDSGAFIPHQLVAKDGWRLCPDAELVPGEVE